jgi:transposase-like protein
MPTDLTNPIFHNEEAARVHFEAIRWPDGKPICPHCGTIGESTLVKGKSHRSGMYQCNACLKPFTVTVGSVMESSHVPLHKWALAFHLMASSKKGISAHQLMRELGIGSYRTAWFLAHRVREAMSDPDPEPLGGTDTVVEVDETFIGPSAEMFINGKGWQLKKGSGAKLKIVSLVERGGRARSVKVEDLTLDTLKKVVVENVAAESTLNTDEHMPYKKIGKLFAKHEFVTHSAGEYGRGPTSTNTVEGFFSIFKRGMVGVYQHCHEKHLHRYLSEFDFRYSNRIALGVDDAERARRSIRGAAGKRLTYQGPRAARAS